MGNPLVQFRLPLDGYSVLETRAKKERISVSELARALVVESLDLTLQEEYDRAEKAYIDAHVEKGRADYEVEQRAKVLAEVKQRLESSKQQPAVQHETPKKVDTKEHDLRPQQDASVMDKDEFDRCVQRLHEGNISSRYRKASLNKVREAISAHPDWSVPPSIRKHLDELDSPPSPNVTDIKKPDNKDEVAQ